MAKRNHTKRRKFTNSAVITRNQTHVLAEDLHNEPSIGNKHTKRNLVNNKWLRFFDKDNKFLHGLLANVNASPVLRSILQDKVTMSLGDGFNPIRTEEQTDSVPILRTLRKLFGKVRDADDVQDLNSVISNVNVYGQTLEELCEQVFFDYWATGNAIVEVIRTPFADDGAPKVELAHVPLYRVGFNLEETLGDMPLQIGIAEEWKNINDNDILTLNRYRGSATEWTERNGQRAFIHLRKYASGHTVWGLPDWVAGRFFAELDYRIAKYNISKHKNGFTPSAIVSLFGAQDPDEARELINNFKRSFTDTGNNSKIFAQVLADKEDSADVQILDDKSDGNYLDLQSIVTQQLVTACRWTMALSGQAIAGTLGSNQQLRAEIEKVRNVCIKPAQRAVLQQIINPFLNEVEEYTLKSINGLRLEFSQINPISIADTIDPTGVLTVDEQRELLGFEALPKDEINADDNQD